MTTVRKDGQPQTSVVWYLLDGDELLIYSKESIRPTNVSSHPRVALNLNSDEWGSSIVSIEGKAQIDGDAVPANVNEPFLERYRGRIDQYGWTPESFARDYPVAIRVFVDKVRAW